MEEEIGVIATIGNSAKKINKLTTAEQKIFGQRLGEIQARLGYDQGQFAKYLGVSQPYLSQIMSGARFGWSRVLDFALKLDVSPEWLIGRDNQILLGGSVEGEEVIWAGHKPGQGAQVAQVSLHDLGLPVNERSYALHLKTAIDNLAPANSLLVLRRGYKPRLGGLVIVTNKTDPTAAVLRILDGEYIDRWVVRHTHDPTVTKTLAKAEVELTPVIYIVFYKELLDK